MDGSKDERSNGRRDELASGLHYAETRAKYCLRGSGSETDNHFWTYCLYFRFEPGSACPDLLHIRLLVYAALTPRFKFEVLHGVGYIDKATIDVGLFKGYIQYTPCRPHERTPAEIL